jgi:hypothetical protein
MSPEPEFQTLSSFVDSPCLYADKDLLRTLMKWRTHFSLNWSWQYSATSPTFLTQKSEWTALLDVVRTVKNMAKVTFQARRTTAATSQFVADSAD